MPELVVLVGLQGAGKTTYFRERYAASHVQVSKDLLRSARRPDERQRELIDRALAEGRSVVVDNTNATAEARAPLVALGRAHGARIVAVWFDATVAECLARNRAREGRARVPDVAIFATAKRLAPPRLEEGFDEVKVVRVSAAGARAPDPPG